MGNGSERKGWREGGRMERRRGGRVRRWFLKSRGNVFNGGY